MTDMGLPAIFVQSFMQSAACELARSNPEVALKHLLKATLSVYVARDATEPLGLSGLEGLTATGEQTMLNAVAGDFRA